MPFNVAKFNSAINKSSIAHTSQFEGFIVGGPGSYSRSGKIRPDVLNRFGIENGIKIITSIFC